MSGKLTATRENALTREELEEFLLRTKGSGRFLPIARISTVRPDGFPHVTPAWYIWEDDKFYISYGARRQHVRNLRENDRIGIIIDEDFRPEKGPEVGAKAVCVRGRATLSTDPELCKEVTRKELTKFLGPEQMRVFLEPALAEGRCIITVEPEHLLTWDFAKPTS